MAGPQDDIARLTDALFRQQLARLSSLAAEEAVLRRKLAGLETMQRAESLPRDVALDARRVGGDVLWRAWLDESRANLNRQLALVLARKSGMLRQVRRAHGRNEAARDIAAQAGKARARAAGLKQRHALEQLVTLTHAAQK